MLAEKEKRFIKIRDVKAGNFYLTPRWSFDIKCPKTGEIAVFRLGAFEGQLLKPFHVISIDDNWALGYLCCDDKRMEFMMPISQLEERDFVEFFFMKIFYTLFCHIRNYFRGLK